MMKSDVFRVLTTKEEGQLTLNQRISYYKQLREYLLETKHENLSKGSLTICPKLNPILRKTLNDFCGYDIYVDNNDFEGLVGLYAFTHQDKFDHVNFLVSNPNHTILLNSAVLAPIYKFVLNLNGTVYVDKSSKEDKQRVKLELMRLLHNGKSITIFPESTWNLSPNKLHLPMYIGMVDMARKTGLPIIPAVQEYEYINKNDGKEHIDYVYVNFGNPIFVEPSDDLFEKLKEVSTAFATLRWNEIEKKGIHTRQDITNADYINFIRASRRNLENAGIDINVEQQYIFGSNDPFYQNHFLNAVDYTEKGELLEAPMVLKKNY